ncbi:conserved hypothetical protein [Xenorhabdus bovienii str. kraussei Quebec]|uniref:Uncharacterized protein n=1 Tax=Xenorhabdus bovienii str. kraussei Quebec TaxID=1398203 RepID=A0A077PHN7_XENBV|nr:hypothetical protein [Xenorhabdus bovienii]MDE9447525.1 hypothetical protein [Xenorhabdus bovienii]CDH20593.1 conserved hypothetical protein [Xenorhabdus bovienii str. kraussei Quebec]
MSEYQYYHFKRLDGVLSAKQKAELRTISSRAEISSSHFTVHYNYSDLKAEPAELMAQYFDVGFYYADWGQVICYLKVPPDTIPLAFMSIEDGDSVICEKGKNYLLFIFSVEENDYYMDDDDAKDYLDHLVELRSELMQGDYRLLYLPWLKSAFDGDETLDELPLINFNFKQLSKAQSAFAELFGIPPEACNALDKLLKSSQAHTAKVTHLSAAEQINSLSDSDKDLLLKSLFEQGQLTANQASALIYNTLTHNDYKYWLSPSSLNAYWQSANEEAARERLLAEEQRREQEWLAAVKRLNAVFSSREVHWENAKKYSEQGHASAYDKAAREMKDLYDAYRVNNALAEFIPRYQIFAKHIERRKTLVQRLEFLNQEIGKYQDNI